MKTHKPEDGPCRSIRPLLDLAADGRARGLRALYARAHAARCPGCGRYLESLQQMLNRLRGTGEAEDEAVIERLSKRLSD